MRVAVGTDQGVMVLKPGEMPEFPWTLVSHGLSTRRIQALAQFPEGDLLAASDQGLVSRTRDGENWQTFAEGLASSNIHSLSLHPSEPEMVFAGTQPAGLFCSQDGAAHWERMATFISVPSAGKWSYPIPPYRAKVKAIRQHPQHPRALLVAVAMGGMIASLDGGLTWSERHQGLSREVNDLALHPARPARVYAATGGGFFRSDDLASTWQEAHQGLPYLFTQALALDPEDPEKLMVGISQQREGGSSLVARSRDGGRTWQVTSNGLPSLKGQCLTAMTSLPGFFIFGTDNGTLYFTRDFGESWWPLRPGCPPIRALLGLPAKT
ncbi:MAG: WD40/YVTN/BNR-like repeat-containing protein [Candidatus Xenobium sp.]|jgi:photosystem II stability/assembly factor-like uncharacterized protein|nr:hypothetical protein [Burkholderiales bacterium]